MTKTMIRQAALVVVAMMLFVPMVSVMDAGNSDASSTSLIPSDYAYKMTYSLEPTNPSNHTQIAGVYKYDDVAGDWVLQTPASNGVDGSFGWDSETGFGPFNMFYAAINVKQTDDKNRISEKIGHVAYVLNPYNLTEYIGQRTSGLVLDEWDIQDYNIMLVIPTVYWYSDENGTMYISNKKDHPGVPSTEMNAYAHTTTYSGVGKEYPYIALGVYEAFCDDNYGMMSKSGVQPTPGNDDEGVGFWNIGLFRDTLTKSNANIAGGADTGTYVIWNFYQWTMYKIISQATIGTKNAQEAIAFGDSSKSVTYSGHGDQTGPYSGSDEYSKLYIENTWGSLGDALDNVYMYNSSTVVAGSGTSPTSSGLTFTIDGDDYTGGNVKTPFFSPLNKADITNQNISSVGWDVPAITESGTYDDHDQPICASGDTFYGSGGGSRLLIVGGSTVGQYHNGLSTCSAHVLVNGMTGGTGTRLAYFMDHDAFTIDAISIKEGTAEFGEVTVVGSNPVADCAYGVSVIIDDKTLVIGSTVAKAVEKEADKEQSYSFEGWFVGDIELTNGSTIPRYDLPIVAKFKNTPIKYEIVINSETGGTVSKDSIADVPGGSSITVIGDTFVVNGEIVTAIPVSGYKFDSWSFENSSVLSDMTVTAKFVEESSYFDVSIKPNDSNYGTVSKTSITNVPYGTKITVSDNVLNIGSDTVTATAESGYYFIEWSMVPATGKTGNIYEITAVFSSDAPTPGKTYNVSIESNDDSYGTVSKSVVSDVPYGTAISVNGSILTIGSETVAASANEGYHFVEWSMVPPSGIVTSGLALKAVFASDSPVPPGPEPPKPRPTPPTITYTLSFECSPGGTVSQSSVKVPMNSPISISGNVLRVGTGSSMKTIQALPDEGYYVASWSVPSYNVLSDMIAEVSFGKLVLAEISVHIPPVKLSYKEGETFEPTGLVLLLKYTDGSIRFLDYKGHESEIAFDKSISTPLEESDKTVKITYEGKSTYQDITVSSEKTDDGFLLWLTIGLIAIALLIIFILLFRRRGEQTQS